MKGVLLLLLLPCAVQADSSDVPVSDYPTQPAVSLDSWLDDPQPPCPALDCYDQSKLSISFAEIDASYPCLRDHCAAITTQMECIADVNFKLGCGWCNEKCAPYLAYQQAFITCTRDAYAGHEPDMVNGVVPPNNVTVPSQTGRFEGSATNAYSFPNGAPGTAGETLINNWRWDLSEVSRGPGERVPIHMHPWGGMICVLEGENITLSIEGLADVTGIAAGNCYTMPPGVKMVTHTSGPGYKDRDTFKTDICYPTWVVLEPDGYFVQDNEFVFTSDIVCPADYVPSPYVAPAPPKSKSPSSELDSGGLIGILLGTACVVLTIIASVEAVVIARLRGRPAGAAAAASPATMAGAEMAPVSAQAEL